MDRTLTACAAALDGTPPDAPLAPPLERAIAVQIRAGRAHVAARAPDTIDVSTRIADAGDRSSRLHDRAPRRRAPGCRDDRRPCRARARRLIPSRRCARSGTSVAVGSAMRCARRLRSWSRSRSCSPVRARATGSGSRSVLSPCCAPISPRVRERHASRDRRHRDRVRRLQRRGRDQRAERLGALDPVPDRARVRGVGRAHSARGRAALGSPHCSSRSTRSPILRALRVGEVRLVDVAIGAAITLGIGAILWPRVGTLPKGMLADVAERARRELATAVARASGRAAAALSDLRRAADGPVGPGPRPRHDRE